MLKPNNPSYKGNRLTMAQVVDDTWDFAQLDLIEMPTRNRRRVETQGEMFYIIKQGESILSHFCVFLLKQSRSFPKL